MVSVEAFSAVVITVPTDRAPEIRGHLDKSGAGSDAAED